MSEIVNRVAKSKLQTINLEDFYTDAPRSIIDLSQWLYEGFVLREADFRAQVDQIDAQSYTGHVVQLICSTEAIIPHWAYMLVQSKLMEMARMVYHAEDMAIDAYLFRQQMDAYDWSQFTDIPVIIKGCASDKVPIDAYIYVTQKLDGVAKSIMYGEACSAVPVYKRKREK